MEPMRAVAARAAGGWNTRCSCKTDSIVASDLVAPDLVASAIVASDMDGKAPGPFSAAIQARQRFCSGGCNAP